MGIFDIFRSKKTDKRTPEWHLFTATHDGAYEYKTSQAHLQHSEENAMRAAAMDLIHSKLAHKPANSEFFVKVTGDDAVAYIYRATDGRRDHLDRPISSYILCYLSPKGSQDYTIFQFMDDIYAKKGELPPVSPTAFDLAATLPVVWDESKSMESSQARFIFAHKHVFSGPFTHDSETFTAANNHWQKQKRSKALLYTLDFEPDNQPQ